MGTPADPSAAVAYFFVAEVQIAQQGFGRKRPEEIYAAVSTQDASFDD